jgi:hypothetical protein
LDKRLAFTFLVGTVVGGISTYLFIGPPVPQFLPGEVKVYTKTEYKTVHEQTPAEIVEVPKYPEVDETQMDENETHDMSSYEAPVEEQPEVVTSQVEKFERSVASENEVQVIETEPEANPDSTPAESFPDPQETNEQ